MTTTETTIVNDLIAHLGAKGFQFRALDTGEDSHHLPPHVAVEFLADLEEAYFQFLGPGGAWHWVHLTPGNGHGIITDWGCPEVDTDGWKGAMETFTEKTA